MSNIHIYVYTYIYSYFRYFSSFLSVCLSVCLLGLSSFPVGQNRYETVEVDLNQGGFPADQIFLLYSKDEKGTSPTSLTLISLQALNP